MKKVALLSILVAVVLLALGVRTEAQQPKKVPRIGGLYAGTPSTQLARMEAFRQGLRELGYVEGKNIIIEYRYAEGKYDRLPALAAELVRLKVDIIITGGSPATAVAKQATLTIPIVMTQVGDPVGSGFVASLARPGGNITGSSTLAPEINGKQLELLKEIVPRLSRVAVFGTSTSPDNAQMLREVELAAKAFGVKLQYLDVLGSKDIETAFRAATKGRAEAVLFWVRGPRRRGSATTGCRPCGKDPTSADVRRGRTRICGSRGAYDLRREPQRLRPTCSYVCGQNP
jgi:ABC-type uncharacterized transport system substrate-binding protein